MTRNLTFGPIKEKTEGIVVKGQEEINLMGCRDDCTRYYWSGDRSARDGCTKKSFTDAHWSVSR